MNEIWQALTREAGLAAEQLAIGISALGKANYAQHAYYGQAFFALSIGLERAAKLALVVDYAVEHNGMFPSNRMLLGYGHKLNVLLDLADEIAKRRALAGVAKRLPHTPIHVGIIDVLSDFADNITRYYNLDLVTGDPRAAGQMDVIRAWFERVTMAVLAAHYEPRQRERHQRNAQLVDQILGENAKVFFHSEEGHVLNSLYEASAQTGITDFARPYTRMYVMQILRFLGSLLSELGYAAHRRQLDMIPELSEFFATFNNSDSYFKRRKTWSIYRP